MPRSCSDSFYMQLIYEYLLHMGLENTASNLKEECRICDYPIPEEICGVRRCDISNLLQRFDEEDEAGFLKILNSSIPLQARSSYEGKKIIADLLVYFAALSILKDCNDQGNPWMKPLVHALPELYQNCEARSGGMLVPRIQGSHSHTSTNSETLERTEIFKCCGQKVCTCDSSKEPVVSVRRSSSQSAESSRRRPPAHPCMHSLLEFLETECANLREDPYFMPYFALPFIASPQTHYQYKHIFQGSWPKNIRRRFWDFLVHHRQAAGLPGIVRLLPSCEVLVTNLLQ
ncbi:hypothetical protein FOCC_FOCC002948 [Frankliniella occidentalis]|nr:hypothetical protein FOCC_FOCC002948 [Frankliniella occidentalis]